MSFPHVIWTLRRTGGTSLAVLLQRYSPFPYVEHEPFTPGRVFSPIVDRFAQDGDADAAETALREALQDRPVIKNCYDLQAPDLHERLMRVTIDLGYRHIVLDRHNEVDRLLSLALARQTGSWGKESSRPVYADILQGKRVLEPITEDFALRQMRIASSRRAWLSDLIASTGIKPQVLFFEDIYPPAVGGEERVRALFRFLDVPMEPAQDFETDLHNALYERSQGSAKILSMVPNIEVLRQRLDTVHAESSNPFVVPENTAT